MKKVLFLFFFAGCFLMACKSEKNTQSTDNQLVEEIKQLDSVNNDLDNTLQEIEQSEADLEAALETLDYE